MHEQEVEGNYDFLHAEHLLTRGFREFFLEENETGVEDPYRENVANGMVLGTLYRMLSMIHNKYGTKADYLQVFDCTYNNKSAKMFVIHDESHVTFMLADEY